MNEQWFEERHGGEWEAFAALVARLDAGDAAAAAELPARYRRLCQQLALARGRRFGAHLVDRLHALVLEGHRHLYAAPRLRGRDVTRFVVRDFPRAVRGSWRLLLLASVLLYGPMLGMRIAVAERPELIYSLLPAEVASTYADMYAPDREALGRGRDAGADLAMFGFYVWNNVSIAFRTFAGGLVLGLGTTYALLWNGLFMGAVEAHVLNAGHGERFWSFVAGHSALELTAITIAGSAGLALAAALLAPGRWSRLEALRLRARQATPLVIGAGGMLLLAAAVEAFWSPRTGVAPPVKYAVGVVLWAAVAAYLGLAGRGGARAD